MSRPCYICGDDRTFFDSLHRWWTCQLCFDFNIYWLWNRRP